MEDRIDQELALLKKEFPNLVYKEEGMWVFVKVFKIPQNIWNKNEASICFQIPAGYPGNPPYGFYIEGGLGLKDIDEKPKNYEEPAQTPFEGCQVPNF